MNFPETISKKDLALYLKELRLSGELLRIGWKSPADRTWAAVNDFDIYSLREHMWLVCKYNNAWYALEDDDYYLLTFSEEYPHERW